MAKDSRNGWTNEAAQGDEGTSLETTIRRRARGLIDAIVEEELEPHWERRLRCGWARPAWAIGVGRATER